MTTRKGFSLLEVLIFVALFSVTAIILVTILINNSELVYKQSSRVSQGLEINDTLSNVKNSIRQASAVSVSYPEGPSPSYTSSPSELVLKLASLDSNNEIIQNTFDYIVYIKSQERIKFLVFPNALSSRKVSNSILAKNVDTLVFDYYSSAGSIISPKLASKVKVSILLKQKAGSGYEKNVATAEADLRND